jgi:hypothetical protein
MTLLRDHIVLMFVYAAGTGLFFSLLWREERRDRIRTFVTIFCALFFGGLALGWLMYPHPIR